MILTEFLYEVVVIKWFTRVMKKVVIGSDVRMFWVKLIAYMELLGVQN